MKKNIILGIIICVCILAIIGMSIWLGFPCETYNRMPIAVTTYLLSFIGIIICIAMAIFNYYWRS